MILHSYEELDTYLGEKVLLVCDSSIQFLRINDYFNGKENRRGDRKVQKYGR